MYEIGGHFCNSTWNVEAALELGIGQQLKHLKEQVGKGSCKQNLVGDPGHTLKMRLASSLKGKWKSSWKLKHRSCLLRIRKQLGWMMSMFYSSMEGWASKWGPTLSGEMTNISWMVLAASNDICSKNDHGGSVCRGKTVWWSGRIKVVVQVSDFCNHSHVRIVSQRHMASDTSCFASSASSSHNSIKFPP